MSGNQSSNFVTTVVGRAYLQYCRCGAWGKMIDGRPRRGESEDKGTNSHVEFELDGICSLKALVEDVPRTEGSTFIS